MFMLLASLFGSAGCAVEDVSGSRLVGDPLDTALLCPSGLLFELGDIKERFADRLPLTVTVCFDEDCDVLSLVDDDEAEGCEGEPGGPPDQLTWCERGSDERLQIAILRLVDDDRSSQHTAAISIQDSQGELAYQQARLVSLDRTCKLRSFDATR